MLSGLQRGVRWCFDYVGWEGVGEVITYENRNNGVKRGKWKLLIAIVKNDVSNRETAKSIILDKM